MNPTMSGALNLEKNIPMRGRASSRIRHLIAELEEEYLL